MSECSNCDNNEIKALEGEVEENCAAVGYQKLSVCVPVTVTPYAHARTTKTKCCGDPAVVSGDTPCEGTKNGVCTFTISQTVCVEVPVDFGATAKVGDDYYVDCIEASSKDICTKCNEAESDK